MDIFKRMTQNNATDFSVFKAKRSQKAESQNNTEKAVPIPLSEAEPKEVLPVVGKAQEKEPREENPVLEEQISEHKDEEKGKVIQFKQPENLNEEAAIKLEVELETAKSNLLPVFPIVRHLKNKCLNDEAFAALVMDERKTLSKCFSYVTDEVKKALNSQNGWLDDNEVYAYAETYFLTDEAVFEQIAAEKAEAEKKRQEEVAKKRKEQEEKRKKADAKKKQKETEEKKKEPIAEKVPEQTHQPEMQEQLCLQM